MNRGMMNKKFLVLFFTLLSSMCGVEAGGNWRDAYGPGSRRFVSSVLSAIALGVGARFVPKLKSKASLLSGEIEALELLLKEGQGDEEEIAKLLKTKRKDLNVVRALLGLAAGSALVGGVKLGHNIWRNEQYRAGLNAFDRWDDATANPVVPGRRANWRAGMSDPLDDYWDTDLSRSVRADAPQGEKDAAKSANELYRRWASGGAPDAILLRSNQREYLRHHPSRDSLEFRRALSDRNRPNDAALEAFNDLYDEWQALDDQEKYFTYNNDENYFNARRMTELGHGEFYQRYLRNRYNP